MVVSIDSQLEEIETRIRLMLAQLPRKLGQIDLDLRIENHRAAWEDMANNNFANRIMPVVPSGIVHEVRMMFDMQKKAIFLQAT